LAVIRHINNPRRWVVLSRAERLVNPSGTLGFLREPGDFVLGFGKPSYFR
jgi:hypothetical protein